MAGLRDPAIVIMMLSSQTGEQVERKGRGGKADKRWEGNTCIGPVYGRIEYKIHALQRGTHDSRVGSRCPQLPREAQSSQPTVMWCRTAR